MKTSTLIITIIVVLLVVSAGVVLFLQTRDTEEDAPATEEAPLNEPGEDAPEEPEAAVESDEVTISDFAYEPANITITAGTTVTWTNEDSVGHNVIAVNEDDTGGLPTEAPLLDEGESFSHTFDEVGTFEYLCEPHPYMRGTVEVTDSEE